MPTQVTVVSTIAVVLACGGAGGSTSPTGIDSTKPPVAPPPPSRADHAMVYDEARHVTFLFGGGGATVYGDSWTWNGSAWTRVATTGPSARRLPSLVYDSRRERVVLFGGQVGTTLLNDTWEWDGSTWTQRSSTGPEPRIHQAAGYDRQRGKVVLYGGAGASDEVLSDTWEWDGTVWRRVATLGVDRWADAIVFDQQRNQLLMLGVERVSGPNRTNRTDLWRWDGAAWLGVGAAFSGPELSPVQPATALGSGGGVLLFDGGTAQNAASTWIWNGSWTKLSAAGPSVRNGTAIAYDTDRRRTVLFGGGTLTTDFGDTWEWDGQQWTRLNPP